MQSFAGLVGTAGRSGWCGRQEHLMNPARLMTDSLRHHPRGRAVAEIMAAALVAVEPAVAVRRVLRREPDALLVGDRRYELDPAGQPCARGRTANLSRRSCEGLGTVQG